MQITMRTELSRRVICLYWMIGWGLSKHISNLGIDSNAEVIVVSLARWGAHHGLSANPEVCGELPRSLIWPQWPQLRYQSLFYYDETKLTMNKQCCQGKCSKLFQNCPLVTPRLHGTHIGFKWPDCYTLVTRVANTGMSQWGTLH